MNVEQEILNAHERGKGFGIAEGMRMMRLKELTDEEIWTIWKKFDPSEEAWVSEEQLRGFAKAFFKKAQEKQQDLDTNMIVDPELAKRMHMDRDGNVSIGSPEMRKAQDDISSS